jgi:hypothetical protein
MGLGNDVADGQDFFVPVHSLRHFGIPVQDAAGRVGRCRCALARVEPAKQVCLGANVVLDALNALYLNVRQGFIVMDSSVIMSLVHGYDKFRVSAEVRKQTHTIVFPFNANENHWFMVVMRKTLLWGTEVRST